MTSGASRPRQSYDRDRYDTIAPLRQSRDIDPVLDLVAPGTTDLLDLGCGTGSLLERAAATVASLERLAGIDLSEERAGLAREKLARFPIPSEVHAADLRRGFPLTGRFDGIVMMSVLHWLHPFEDDVFRTIGRHAKPRGRFIFSTYHPERRENDLGGTDAIVHAALIRMGWSPEAADDFFADPDHLPISRRTRPKHEIKALLTPVFEIDRVVDQVATMRVESHEQYLQYHTSTFGGYYWKRLPEDAQEPFFDALGTEAMARMDALGHVTAMPVRIWRCTCILDKRIDVV